MRHHDSPLAVNVISAVKENSPLETLETDQASVFQAKRIPPHVTSRDEAKIKSKTKKISDNGLMTIIELRFLKRHQRDAFLADQFPYHITTGS